MTPPRIAPIDPPYADDVAATLHAMMGNRSDPPPLALFRTLMSVPDLGSRIRPLGGFFLTKGALDARHRELVIHRVTARLGAEYEWGVHAVLFAGPLGLGDEWLGGTVSGTAGSGTWSLAESALVAATDQLLAAAAIDDAAWAALTAHFSEAQLLEFLMLAGWYVMISFVANAARVPLEPWARRFGDVVSSPALPR